MTNVVLVVVIGMMIMVVIVTQQTMSLKCEKYVFFKTKNQLHNFFLDFRNKCKNILKII